MTTTTAILTETEETLTLERLSALTSTELESLYRAGDMPASMNALDGSPKGRMLAIRGIDSTPLSLPVNLFARANRFPWEGKSFKANQSDEGEGINRLNLVVYKGDAFPFKTVHDQSAIDGQPCIYLDYDLKGNPWLIRKIRDELREIAPGLFLGPAMWKKRNGGAALVLWFAIDTRR